MLQGLEMKLNRLSSGVSAKFDLTFELFDEGDVGMLGKMQFPRSFNEAVLY